MTLEEIAEIQAREKAATSAPWYKGVYSPNLYGGEGRCVSHGVGAAICYFDRPGAPEKDEADQDFIVHARDDVPALCAALLAERQKSDRLQKALTHADERRVSMSEQSDKSHVWLDQFHQAMDSLRNDEGEIRARAQAASLLGLDVLSADLRAICATMSRAITQAQSAISGHLAAEVGAQRESMVHCLNAALNVVARPLGEECEAEPADAPRA